MPRRCQTGRTSSTAVEAACRARGPWAKVQDSGSPITRSGRWPSVLAALSWACPPWAVMQKLGLPQGTPLHHHAHSPGTGAVAGRRTSAKCPPSTHPISLPPAAEDACPVRSQDTRRPPAAHRHIGAEQFADSGQRLGTASPTQTWPPSQAASTSAPTAHPPATGKTLHPSDGIVAGIRHSGKEK